VILLRVSSSGVPQSRRMRVSWSMSANKKLEKEKKYMQTGGKNTAGKEHHTSLSFFTELQIIYSVSF
jgi:hypothetical protein